MLVAVFGCDQRPKELVAVSQIKGVIKSIDCIAEGSSFNAADIKQTIVRFNDGKVKAFNGTSNEVFAVGKVNIITYDQKNRIISVIVQQ